MKACTLDIETTTLDATGFILGIGIHPLDDEGQYNPKTAIFLRYDTLHDRPGHEKKLLRALFDELSKYQLWIGHNIIRFDWPMITSRAYQEKVSYPFAPAFVYDTMLAFRRTGFKTRDNGFGKPKANLGHVIDFVARGKPGDQLKTAIYPFSHRECVYGKGKIRTEMMDVLEAHCLGDLQMTEQTYWELLRVDRTASLKRVW